MVYGFISEEEFDKLLGQGFSKQVEDEWVEGRYRLLRMRSGRKFYQVECLEQDYYVMDGIWDYQTSGRIENGSGDYIE